MNKSVVVHVVTELNFGGVERHIEAIARVLHVAEMKHIFVAIGVGGVTADKLVKLGAECQCLGLKTKILSFGTLIGLYRSIKKISPMIVHTHGAEANFYGLITAAILGIPVRVGEEIGIPSHSLKAKSVFRLVYRTAHCVIGISKNVTAWLVASREVRPEYALCLYNPVELPVRSEFKKIRYENLFRVCFVGRLEAVKNPLVLIKAAQQLIAMGVPIEVWIIGDGSQRKQIEEEISNLELSKTVKLLGFQSDPFLFLRQCNLYVQPSLSEGFGIAMVEAMGCGLPVVVTNVGGAPEIVNQGETGWLLPDASAETLAETLHAAWSLGAGRLADMGQLARTTVEGRFEPSSYLTQLETLYAQIAEKRGINVG